MALLDNPYSVAPAQAHQFVGCEEILARWRERLRLGSTSWNDGKHWLIIGPSGFGKTSLLNKLRAVAETEYNAHPLYIDLGAFYDRDTTEGFFDYLDRKLPEAQQLSTHLRQWLDLEPDASLADVGLQAGAFVLKSMQFAPPPLGGFGLTSIGLMSKSRPPQDLPAKVANLFNRLAVLSSEQEKPVVVLVDQIGRVHDSKRWLFIAEQWLYLAQQVSAKGPRGLIFVFNLRPEHEDNLKYQLRRDDLFDRRTFHFEFLL